MIRVYKKKFAELSREYEQKSAEILREYEQKSVEILRECEQKLAELLREYEEKLAKIPREDKQKLVEILREYNQKLIEIRQEYEQKSVEISREYDQELTRMLAELKLWSYQVSQLDNRKNDTTEQNSLYVNLSGWQTAREILEYEGYLFFEVAEIGHCSICQSRIMNIKAVVSKKKLQVKFAHLLDRFPRDAKTLWVGIAKPHTSMTNEEIKEFIGKTFDLPIL